MQPVELVSPVGDCPHPERVRKGYPIIRRASSLVVDAPGVVQQGQLPFLPTDYPSSAREMFRQLDARVTRRDPVEMEVWHRKDPKARPSDANHFM